MNSGENNIHISCPQCGAAYDVPARLLGTGTRQVRCTRCGTFWQAGSTSPESAPASTHGAPGPDADAQTPARSRLDRVPARVSMRALRRTGAGEWAGYALLLIACLALWLAVVWRDNIITVFPDLASLYARLGLPANRRGLIFETVTMMRGGQKARSGQTGAIPPDAVYVVEARLRNVTDEMVDVPMIRLSLMDGERREIHNWFVTPSAASMSAGDWLAIRTEFIDPLSQARDLELRFVDAVPP